MFLTKTKKTRKIFIIMIVLIVLFFILFFTSAYIQRQKILTIYQSGINKFNSEEYQESKDILNKLGNYKESLNYIELASKNIAYNNAIDLFNKANFNQALEEFHKLDNFKESKEYIAKTTEILDNLDNAEKLYEDAYKHYLSENYIQAINDFTILGDYKDSQSLLYECRINLARLQYSTTISAGIRYSAGIIEKGIVKYSGDDHLLAEELSTWKNVISISIKGHLAIGMKKDGTVFVAGKIPNYPKYYIDTSTWNDIIAVSSGQQYIVGLRSNGTLVAQGHNGDDQLNIDDWSNIIAISSGWRHTVGLSSDGKVYITGYGSQAQLKKIENNIDKWNDIIDIAAGGGSSNNNIHEKGHTVALKKDHTVVAVSTGCTDEHEVGCPCNVNEWSDIIAISAGDFHTVGLKSDGTVVTTQIGETADEISKWTDIVEISAGYGFTLGVKSNGEIVSTGFNKNQQIQTGDWENIITYPEVWKSLFDENLKWSPKKLPK